MLDFECPSCRARCQVADAYAGKTVVCPQCAQTATLPHRDDAATAVTTPDLADAAQLAKERRHDPLIERDTFSIARDGGAAWSRTQRTGCVIGGILIVVTIIGLLTPCVQRVHVTSARTQAINNLKQIVLAMHGFDDANKRLPFNGTRDAVANDEKSGSWAFQILPYIDQGPMYQNPQAAQTVSVAAFMCPGRSRSTAVVTGPTTDYHLNIYLNTQTIGNGWNAPDANVDMKNIGDGTSNTVFVGQGWVASSAADRAVVPGQSNSIFLGGIADLARGGKNVIALGAGPDVVLQRDTAPLPAGAALIPWGGPFSQGVLMGMGDGTVRMFPYSMSGTTFGAFLTPNNGDNVVVPDTPDT